MGALSSNPAVAAAFVCGGLLFGSISVTIAVRCDSFVAQVLSVLVGLAPITLGLLALCEAWAQAII